jgi:hypothetical protein
VAAAKRRRNVHQTAETFGTQNAILMLGDTFSAKKTTAFRATGNSFPILMIPAPLVMQFSHY